MFVNDYDSGPIINPAGLSPDVENQHARVDLLLGGSDPFDTGAAVLDNFYLGVDGGINTNDYTNYTFDISAMLGGGDTYMIRFANVNTNFFMNLGVDNVSLQYEPVPEPSTILLMGIGLLGLAGFSRKRFSKKS